MQFKYGSLFWLLFTFFTKNCTVFLKKSKDEYRLENTALLESEEKNGERMQNDVSESLRRRLGKQEMIQLQSCWANYMFNI